VKNIIASDYPDHWPTLLPALQRSLASGDQSLVSGALRVLRIISRKYEYRDADDRGPLNAMVNGIFPTLLHVFQALLANPSPSPDLAELLKLCCKIFWSSTYLEIPAILATEEQFTGWMGALLALAGRAVPTEGMPEDSEGRKEWPWWKAKKWVYNVSYRLFTNLGRPSKSRSYDHDQQEHRHVKAFAERWRQECSLPFLSAVMNELTAVGRGAYISPRVANITLQYVTAAVDQPATWKVLKPHVQDIIKHVVFPMLAFNADDAMLWQDDPEEYVRKGYDVIEDLYSPKTAGMGLLAKVCTAKKAKKSELDPTMAYIVQLLGEFKAQGEGQASDELAGKVDGVLLAIGTLQDVLKVRRKIYP